MHNCCIRPALACLHFFHHLAWRQVMLTCIPSQLLAYVSRESSRTKIYGPNFKGTAKVFFFSLSFSFCFARIPRKAQQQVGPRPLYSKAEQHSANLLIAGKFGVHARESMNHTRLGITMFGRDFGVNESSLCLTKPAVLAPTSN